MLLLFFNLAFVAGSFLLLRTVFLATGEKQPSRLERFLVGAISWVFILSAAAWLLMPLYFVYLLLGMHAIGAIYPLMFFGMATGLAFQAKETLDAATVLHFLRQSAMFRPIKPHTMVFQEELDKKKIRDVHRETSHKPFPTIGRHKRPLSEKEIHEYQQKIGAAKERPTRSRHFKEELALLKTGETANISDPWKVYTFDHNLHDLYAEMSELHINPQTRVLQFKLNIPGAKERALQDSVYIYRLKQDLYHLLQVLNTDPWIAWYNEFFDRLALVCYGIEPDTFGHVQMFPFMKIDIARPQLFQRDGKIFNAGDLHTICTLTFDSGRPLPDDLL